MNTLKILRRKIDKIDEKIIKLLQKRAKAIKKIRQIKAKLGLRVVDKERENEILEKLEGIYEKEIFKKILAQSRKIQG